MTLDEAIKHAEEVADKKNREKKKWERWLENDSDYRAVAEKVSCELCAKEHRQLAEWLKDYQQLKEQESCEDEYIKVPKKALKYRTAGMVTYNAEWLKNHFDIERAVICGVQQPCEDCISRQAVLDKILKFSVTDGRSVSVTGLWTEVNELPPVTPQEPCEDIISRQAAIEALQEVSEHYTEKGREWHPHVNFMVDAIKGLSSVTPQPKTGHWIEDEYEMEVRCSACGEENDECSKYCPNCGAKM